MRNYFLPMIAGVLFTVNANAQNDEYQVACIGFYNVENLFDVYNSADIVNSEYTPDDKEFSQVVVVDGEKPKGRKRFKEEFIYMRDARVTDDGKTEFLISEYNVEGQDAGEEDAGREYADWQSMEQLELDIRDDDNTPDGFRRYTEEVYQSKLENLSSIIAKLGSDLTPDGPAILGLSEIENEGVVNDLVAHPNIADRNYQVIHRNSLDRRGVDVAMIYQPKYFTVEEVRSIPVIAYEKSKKEYPDRIFTRDILYVKGIFLGEEMHVFVNHWSSRRGVESASSYLREAAAAAVKEVCDQITAEHKDADIIIMGDLNDDPNSKSVSSVLQTKYKKEEIKSGDLYNPWLAQLKKGQGTLAYGGAWNLFDQIIVSSGLVNAGADEFRFYDAKSYSRGDMTQKISPYMGSPYRAYGGSRFIGGYSDHFPTYIVLLKKIS